MKLASQVLRQDKKGASKIFRQPDNLSKERPTRAVIISDVHAMATGIGLVREQESNAAQVRGMVTCIIIIIIII